MAGTSPRRSVRARTSQPSGSHHSSASSNSSNRAERNTRTSAKIESPRKSTPSASLSSEPLDDTVAPTIEDTLGTRRRKRGQVDESDDTTKHQSIEEMNGDDDIAEGDDAVRCICGFEDYPGPPQLTDEDKKLVGESIEIVTAADVTEDLAGFFLQCDNCKVWQHGGCVGIKNEDMSPADYFCELCRVDLHKVFTASNGQKYSQYLPVTQSFSRGSSHAAFSKDGTRSPKGGRSGRASSALQSAKRRSTMNSRDAAYDEEEQMRLAIEASKKGDDKSGESADGTIRRGKRGRSDSEDKEGAIKRQRTLSESPSPQRDLGRFAVQPDSDEDTKTRNGGAKKIRGAAARNHREKEAREERERIRTEAANKRKGRAERRRVEDSEPPEETPPANKAEPINPPTEPPASSQPVAPDSPPAVSQPSSSHKKGGRPPHNRKGKLGKNQYTRDRDVNGNDDDSPGRSQSRDVSRDENGTNHRTANGDGKVTKSKMNGGSKVTFQDMKRKVAWMLDFISKTQLDMASESIPPTSNGDAEALIRGIAGSIIPMLNNELREGTEGSSEADKQLEKDFKDLKLLEMMDVLTRMLVKWQKEYT